jgi:RNA polymerase sigma-70 factor (ECF subfamily)
MARRKSAARARAVAGLERELHTAGPASREPDAALDLDRALAALGAEERAAVLLCYAAGMSHSQVAEAMAAPLGTVKSWIVRGRAKLKERLADHVRT